MLSPAIERGRCSSSVASGQRVIFEREARAFAAELLMPFAEVSQRWYRLLRERPVTGELSEADRVRWLAREFNVTASAMRIRLELMRILG